eukprot:5262947-Amphidinium_carterae.2
MVSNSTQSAASSCPHLAFKPCKGTCPRYSWPPDEAINQIMLQDFDPVNVDFWGEPQISTISSWSTWISPTTMNSI